MNKTCKNCIYFVNNTCVNTKSEYCHNPYQTIYDVCGFWSEKECKEK